MTRSALALAVGIVFGAGLELSQMTNPAKVQNFLDLFGIWDPSLAFVMGAALVASTAGVWIARRRTRPWLAETFSWPDKTDLDFRLLGGAALFGIGWGLAGFCPGPALANLFRLDTRVLLFVVAMLAGVAIQAWAFAPARAKGGSHR
jgi:uncharacterized membrane protein YedE/YeeE